MNAYGCLEYVRRDLFIRLILLHSNTYFSLSRISRKTNVVAHKLARVTKNFRPHAWIKLPNIVDGLFMNIFYPS